MENNHNQRDDSIRERLDAIRKKFELENQKIEEEYQRIEKENKKLEKMYRQNDFNVSKFKTYSGPNYYLDRKAVVFNLFIAPEGDTVDFYKQKILKVFPLLEQADTPYVVDLFAETLLHMLKMDIDLYINKYSITTLDDEYVIAIEYLDDQTVEDAAYLVSDWFKAMSEDREMDIMKEYLKLQEDFDATLFGGPTLYSLIEAGLKRKIPVFYLYEENQFQWGYGRKQLRGRSTTFSTDGIKDTEFTMFKDMVGDFLEMCGFPTPKGKNCYEEDEIVDEALKIGFPVVIKPVAGHKGQGVVTGIESEEEVRKAFRNIVKMSEEIEGVNFDGALVQQQIYGTDHRMLSVGGKFAAALERVPAFVDGDGRTTIEELIEIENNKIIRLDNARSPLAKIKTDQDLKDYLALQDLNLESVPEEDKRIYLRRVANISAGGVSINVTDKVHEDNIKLVEDISAFFNVKCLGIDVLAADISKSWREGNFGIIEINAGPGVFMHLAPAYGGSLDIPGMILGTHFKTPGYARIPIISGNKFSKELSEKIGQKVNEIEDNAWFASLLDEGIFFNNNWFYKNPSHDENVKIILRHPQTSLAMLQHNVDDIFDYGIFHEGADIVVLDNAGEGEETTFRKQLLPGALLIKITPEKFLVKSEEEVVKELNLDGDENTDDMIYDVISQYLPDLLVKYE